MGEKRSEDWREQGKQVADAFAEGVGEIRDSLTEKTAQHEDTIKSRLGRLAGYLDERTGRKHTDKLDKANARLAEGVGRVADEGRASAARRQAADRADEQPSDDEETR